MDTQTLIVSISVAAAVSLSLFLGLKVVSATSCPHFRLRQTRFLFSSFFFFGSDSKPRIVNLGARLTMGGGVGGGFCRGSPFLARGAPATVRAPCYPSSRDYTTRNSKFPISSPSCLYFSIFRWHALLCNFLFVAADAVAAVGGVGPVSLIP